MPLKGAKNTALQTRRYSRWLNKTDLEPSLASDFAYAVLARFVREMKKVPHDNKVRSTFQTTCRLGREEDFEDWILPQLQVDLLQLAVLCGDTVATGLLLQLDHFKAARYEETRGGVLMTENHPVHLACVFGTDLECLQPLMDARPDVLWSEGVVTLEPSPCPSLSAPASRRQRPGLQGSPTQLALKSLNLTALQNLLRRGFLALSDVESGLLCGPSLFFLWETLSMAQDALLRPYVVEIVLGLSGNVHVDVLLLFCHRLITERWTALDECSIGCLPVPVCFLPHSPYLSQFLTEAQLFSACSLIQKQLKCLQGVATPSKTACRSHRQNEKLKGCSQVELTSLLEDFQEEKRSKTLQTECIWRILEELKGDCRLAGSIAMPGGLRKFFPVPFYFVLDKFLQGLP